MVTSSRRRSGTRVPRCRKYISRHLSHLEELAPPPPTSPALPSFQVVFMSSRRQLDHPSVSTTPAHPPCAAQAAQKNEIKKVQHRPNPGIGQPLARPQIRPRLLIRRANGASAPSSLRRTGRAKKRNQKSATWSQSRNRTLSTTPHPPPNSAPPRNPPDTPPGKPRKNRKTKKAHMQHMQPIPKSDAPAPPCTSSALLFSTDP